MIDLITNIQYAFYRVRGDSFSFQQVNIIYIVLKRHTEAPHLFQEHMGLLRKVMLEELLSGNLM